MSNNSVVGLRSDKPLPFPIYTPSSYTHLNISMPQYGYSSASSFSSASEATGSSFSSADALPAISRNFVRPSPTETRRPATAGGALQTRSPFVGFMEDGDRFQRLNQRSSTASAEVSHASQVSQTIDEGSESVFGNPNPFSSPIDKENGRLLASQTPASTLDNHYASHVDDTRTMYQQSPGSLHYSSSPFNSYLPITSAPTSSYHDNFTPSINANQQLQQFQRPMSDSARPQTSDGLPRYASVGSGVSLPSARTLVNQIDAFATPQTFFSPRRNETLQPTSLMPFRDSRATSLGNNQDANTSNRAYSIDSSKTARPSYIHPSSPMNSEDDPQGELTFVSTGGSGPKKRPRRRFDEIERLYTCGWNGCEKAYGTLNHLNAHVAMQKHGIKRLPSGE